MFLFILLCFSVVSGVEVNLNRERKEATWPADGAQGGMSVGGGRVKRVVELDGKQTNVVYPACQQANGKQGVCKPVRQCTQTQNNKDTLVFLDNLCNIDQSKIGVCCEEVKVSGPAGLAGELPAIAANDEAIENRLDVRTENRGCGLSTRPHARVMGARPANPREWPWMASVAPVTEDKYCGGTLITDRHVLTAAHCTEKYDAEYLYVRLGEYDFRRSNDTRSYNFNVVEKREHEFYDNTNFMNDISILKLHRPAVFNTYVWPICLPPMGMDLVNQTAVVIGWGTEFYGGPKSDVLMEVSLPVWDHEICTEMFTDSVFNETLCAGAYAGGKDACQGDSGGPLMYQMSSGRWAVIGVVSWGIRCGEPNHPGLYTSVEHYLDWIVENARF